MAYTVLIACRSDATGIRFKPGDTVRDGDFPAEVIEHWLEIGVLARPAAQVAAPARTSRKKVTRG